LPEQRRVEKAVFEAAEGGYRARSAYTTAINAEADTSWIEIELAEARKAERAAVHALDAHRKEHGC